MPWIYKVDEDWFVANSPEEASTFAGNYYAGYLEEDEFETAASPLPELEMDRLKYSHEDGRVVSFRDFLAEYLSEGGQVPNMFASLNF